jgi:hypothetical protein
VRILVLSGLATMANAMGEAKLLEVEELKGDVRKGSTVLLSLRKDIEADWEPNVVQPKKILFATTMG